MGINALHLKWLTQQIPKKNGEASICTIARQTSYLTDQELDRHLKYVGQEFQASKPLGGEDPIDDILLHTFGGQEVTAFDVSDYEGASVRADLNYPIDRSLYESADLVIDGGSLEHVFNVTQCLYNYMNLIKVGGNLCIMTTASNYCGHGFYQFSPELFYSLFTEDRGFSVQSMVLMLHPYPSAAYGHSKCYEVASPMAVQSRVGLMSRKAALVMVHAMKTKHVDLSSVPYPIQSDYLNLHLGENENAGSGGLLVRSVKHVSNKYPLKTIANLTPSLLDHMKGLRRKLNYSLANKRYYKRWVPPY